MKTEQVQYHALLLLALLACAHSNQYYPPPPSYHGGFPTQPSEDPNNHREVPPQYTSAPPPHLAQQMHPSQPQQQQQQQQQQQYSNQPQASQYPPGFPADATRGSGMQLPRSPYASSIAPYRRGPQPQQTVNQQEGFFSKIKNSILAAGSAITQTFDGPGQDAPSAPSLPSSYHGYPPRNPTPPSGPFGSPPGTLYSQKANPAYTQEYSQPPPQHSQLPGSMQDFHGREHAYPAAPVRNAQFPPQSSDYSPEETNESGLFNKIKTFLGPDEVQANIPASLGSGYHYTESQYSTLSSNPPLPQRYENTYYSSQPPRHPSEGLPPASSGFFEPPQQQSYTGANPSKWPLTDNVGIQPESVKFLQPPDFSHIPNDPQIFNFEESVVMILKPRDFYRKKYEMTQGGPQAVQVFSDFEHVFTKFKHADGGRTMGTSDLLESSGAISNDAIEQIRQITEEFDKLDDVQDEQSFFDMSARCQAAVARHGSLHIGNVPVVTRNFLPRLGMRDGWKSCLQSLTMKGVPTYLFSSGYGDVVTQALLQSGIASNVDTQNTPNQNPAYLGSFPQNIRVISNFFRTGPDGTVRGFSQPIVHEKNKNASTAERHMDMPLPSRPYAIVLASHEDDALMVDGIAVKDQITIGFLELADDLPQRLPTYLKTFDIVIVGEANLNFVKSMLDEILQIPSTKRTETGGKLGLGLGFRKGLGKLLAGPDSREEDYN